MNIVLLAFDGLSYRDLVEEERFNLSEVRDFETVDKIQLTQTDFYYTSELFTDLITGVSRYSHGITGLKKFTPGAFGLTPQRFELWLQRNLQPFFYNGISFLGINFLDRGFRNAMYEGFLGSNYRKWEREDIQVDTVFEEFPGQAHQGQVPVWDWRYASVFHHMKNEHRTVSRAHNHIEEEWEKSKNKFWDGVEEVDWDDDPQFYMHHFHYVDWLQHLYRADDFDKGIDRMSTAWWNVSEFVDEVRSYVDELEDTELVVMSDHGIPQTYIGHRPEAFIAHNTSIFPEKPTLQEMYWAITEVLRGVDNPATIRANVETLADGQPLYP